MGKIKLICIILYALNGKYADEATKVTVMNIWESRLICLRKSPNHVLLDLWIFSKAAFLKLISNTDNKVLILGKVVLVFLAFVHIIIFSFSSNGAVAWWDFAQGAAHRNPRHAQRAFPWDGTPFVVAHHLFKHLPEAGGHEVVENRINGWAQIEEDPRDDMDVLVDLENLHVLTALLVHETPHESIGVERSPADAKHDN